jgi:hypothetical protein
MGVGVERGCGRLVGWRRVWVGGGYFDCGGLWVGGGYFDFGVRKRKIVPLAGFPNAWATEFPGNGVGSLTECISILNFNGGRYNQLHFNLRIKKGGSSTDNKKKIIA